MSTTSPSGRPTLVVLAAPPGPLAGVRDALRDWSALGLVTSFLWVEVAADQPAGQLPAELIFGGRAQPVTVENVIEEQPLERIRLAILVPALRDAAAIPAAGEDRIASLIRSAGGGTRVERLRFVVTRPDSGPGSAAPARPEWHNLVISPEDGQGPGRGLVQLMPTVDAIELGAPAAATICGATGLWTGLEAAPLDGQQPMPGSTVRVIRSFHRRLEAADVEDRVRAAVTGVGNGLPRPRTGGTRSIPSDDQERDTGAVARAFWQQHGAVLDSGQVKAEPVPVKETGLRDALVMFLSFLRATLVNAVPRWYQSVVYRINVDVAKRAQRALFGDNPAAYAVMVNGVRADDEPADWRDLAASSQQLEAALGQQQQLATAGESGRARLTTLWRDLAGAALTLADAGEHPGGTPPLQRGIDRAYVRSPTAIAPGAESAFPDLTPYRLATGQTTSGTVGLRPTDVLAVETTERQLSRLSQQPGAGAEIDRALAGLRDWRTRHAGSFTVQVGAQLAQGVKRHTASVRGLLAQLAEAAQGGELDADLQRKQRRLAILIRALLGLLVVVVGVDVVLGVKAVIEPHTAVGVGVAAVLVWFVGTAAAFTVQQRNLFAVLHRRRQAASDAEVNQRNLAIALGDLRRTSQAYGEFLEWARIIAVVLAEPFGNADADLRPAMVIGDGMPRSVRVGVARPDESVLADVVEQLRAERYHFGWLGPIWEEVLADAHRRLGPAARELRDDPGLMYSQAPGPDHLLTRWADLLETEGTGTAAGDALWRETLTTLEDTPLGDSLLTEVVPADGGRPRPLADFMAGIGEVREGDGGVSGAATTEFDYAVFRRQAHVAGKAAVSRTYVEMSSADGLAKAAVTVQLSEGMPVYDLNWSPKPPTQGTTAGDDPAPPPPGLDQFDQVF